MPHHPYSVFINARTGKSGLVICNYDEHSSITVTASLENSQALERYRLVDAPEWKPAQQGIEIPPQSAVIII
jgi:hypothetical protein